MKIYDNPSHPQYGPVRRMWVIFAQLALLDHASRYHDEMSDPWDVSLARSIEAGISEARAQRILLFHLISTHEAP